MPMTTARSVWGAIAGAALALWLGGGPVLAAGEWVRDGENGCAIWDQAPAPEVALSWSGGCEAGKAEGAGTAEWKLPDGSLYRRYEGGFHEGLRHGRGKLTEADGAGYEGEYKDGLMHGQGNWLDAEGNRYEGALVDGRPHGQGICSSPYSQAGSPFPCGFDKGRVLLWAK